MSWLGIFRLATLIFTLVCGIIVLALGGHMISETESFIDPVYYDYAALGVATGVLALVTIPVMIALDFFASTFTSWIAVELGWLGLLWILFLAAGADAANEMNKLNNQCDFISNIYQNICHETQALAAFAFLVWIALTAYTVTLLVVAILNSGASTNIWTSSVKDTFGGSSSYSGTNHFPMTSNTVSQPVTQPLTQTV